MCCRRSFPRSSAPPKRQQASATRARPISIRGLTEGISYKLGQCCHPLPGDRIVGLMVPGEGIVVHTIDCAELDKAQATWTTGWM